MKKRLVASILVAAMAAFALVGCSSNQGAATETTGAATETTGTEAETVAGTYRVGICQLVQHEALDAATKGFKDALTEKLGDAVEFDEQNASGDSANCATIVNGFVAKNVDLILANATPALQAASAATDTIPVLGTSITEYGVALGIDGFTGTVGNNVSGTSDLAPLDEQANLIKQFFPDAKNVGLLYCSAEANSAYQVETVKEYLTEMGYTCEFYSFSDSNDISAVLNKAVSNCQVIYVPTDNAVASNTELINNICTDAKVPVVAGEEGICGGCGTVTLSISYYDLGYATGLMAAKILTGQANVAEMPIEYAPQFTPKYNAELCKLYNLNIPAEFEEIVVE